ncbi:MAG: DUF4263 domain-containing protein [Acidobacteria bacterium]|nr:DUF4263 domain-containing protein [Acidobacteriota bacterium]
MCFVEIKAHTTPLLQNAPYRPGCWAPSEHLAGGVAQVQGTVENAGVWRRRSSRQATVASRPAGPHRGSMVR